MKQLSPALQSHLSGEATTLCRCWRLTRRDGVSLGFTDHDRDIEFDGLRFEAGSAWAASEIESSLGFGVDSVSVEGALVSGAIEAGDLRADRYDGALVETWLVNWAKPDQRMREHVWTLGETVEEDDRFRAELESASAALDRRHARRFARNCDADLGDANCGVDLGKPAFSGSAVVTEILSPLVLGTDGLGAFETGWFRGGRILFQTGANAELAGQIAEHEREGARIRLHLWKALPFALSPGDGFQVTAGCPKTFSACRTRFSNAINFRGFPHIPGNDFTFSSADPDAPMDGGALVS